MLNVAALMGRMVVDPELKHTPSDIAVCSFRIAVDRNIADSSGDGGTAHRHSPEDAEKGTGSAVFPQKLRGNLQGVRDLQLGRKAAERRGNKTK